MEVLGKRTPSELREAREEAAGRGKGQGLIGSRLVCLPKTLCRNFLGFLAGRDGACLPSQHLAG